MADTCYRLIILGGITVVVRIAINIVRVGVLIELALGILFWTGNADSLQIVHIVIGILIVLSLFALGIAQGFQGCSFLLGLVTLVVGCVLLLGGVFRVRWLFVSIHWSFQVILVVLVHSS